MPPPTPGPEFEWPSIHRTPPNRLPPREVLYIDRDQATLVVGRAGVVVWRGPVSLAAVERVREMGLAVLKASPKGAVLVGVVESTAVPPEGQARVRSAAVNDELSQLGISAFIAIFPQSGLKGAAMRGVMTGLTLLSRTRFPMRIFQETHKGIEWGYQVQPQADMNWSGCSLQIDSFRDEYASRHHLQAPPEAFASLWPTRPPRANDSGR
jgi:hypothetical protein